MICPIIVKRSEVKPSLDNLNNSLNFSPDPDEQPLKLSGIREPKWIDELYKCNIGAFVEYPLFLLYSFHRYVYRINTLKGGRYDAESAEVIHLHQLFKSKTILESTQEKQ